MGPALLMLSVFVFLLPMVLLFICYHYCVLRDPKRVIPGGKNLVSPSDGRILKISGISGGWLVTIRVAIWDVQTHRSPADAILRKVEKTHKRTSMILKTDWGEISLDHKALKNHKPRLQYNKGEPYGHFSLGGCVRLKLPEKVHLLVHKGQKVTAGRTVIGTFSGF